MKGMKKGQGIKNSLAQSLVEFALVLPLLLVLIVGAIEFGRLFYTKIVITNSAREGAYYLSTHESDANAAAYTVLAAETEAEKSGIPEITVDIDNCLIESDCVRITVESIVEDFLILGFLGNAFSITASNNDFVLSSSVEMMVEP